MKNWKESLFSQKIQNGKYKKYLAHFGSENHKFSIVLNLQVIGMSVWYAEIFLYKRQNGFNNDLYVQYQYNIQEGTKRGLRKLTKWFLDWQQ